MNWMGIEWHKINFIRQLKMLGFEICINCLKGNFQLENIFSSGQRSKLSIILLPVNFDALSKKSLC